MFYKILMMIFKEDEITEIVKTAEERHIHPRELIRQAVLCDLFR